MTPLGTTRPGGAATPLAMRLTLWGLLALLAVPLSARQAGAEEGPTFDALAAEASRGDLQLALEVLTMRCEESDPRLQRACEVVLRERRERVRGRAFLVSIDAPQVTPRENGRTAVTVGGCLLCAQPAILGGIPHRITSQVPPPPPRRANPGAGSDAAVPHLAEVLLPDPGPQRRVRLRESLARTRAEAVVRLQDARPWQRGDVRGVAVKTVAWRVVDPCTGRVYVSHPESSVVMPTPDDPVCRSRALTREPVKPTGAALPESLSQAQIQHALEPLRRHGQTCFRRFRIRGRVDIALDVRPNGTVKMVRSSGPLVDTPSANCVRSAALRLRFPRFKSRTSMHITYPVLLR